MEGSLRVRVVSILLLAGILVTLLVWAGTIEPDPADNRYPGSIDIHENPETYVGDRVAVSGRITGTEPLTIRATFPDAGTETFVIENAAVDVAVGDHLVVFGTLQPDNRVEAIDTLDREPWELYYMYVVSFLGGLLVLGRLINGWTVDTETWSIVPRTDPLVGIPP